MDKPTPRINIDGRDLEHLLKSLDGLPSLSANAMRVRNDPELVQRHFLPAVPQHDLGHPAMQSQEGGRVGEGQHGFLHRRDQVSRLNQIVDPAYRLDDPIRASHGEHFGDRDDGGIGLLVLQLFSGLKDALQPLRPGQELERILDDPRQILLVHLPLAFGLGEDGVVELIELA